MHAVARDIVLDAYCPVVDPNVYVFQGPFQKDDSDPSDARDEGFLTLANWARQVSIGKGENPWGEKSHAGQWQGGSGNENFQPIREILLERRCFIEIPVADSYISTIVPNQLPPNLFGTHVGPPPHRERFYGNKPMVGVELFPPGSM